MMGPRDRSGLFCTQLMIAIILFSLMAAILSGCSPTIKYVCPPLAAVPSSTLDALEAKGRQDPSTASWVIDLDRHYQKLDVCRP